MKNFLITGATGFVGRKVVEKFLNEGKQVTALGRTKPDQEVDFLQADFTDSSALKDVLKGKKFDCILHIASLPGDTGNPLEMVNVNVDGCLNLLEFARESGIKKFILASSISAYEWYPATKFRAPGYLPVDESHPCNPADMYSVTKYMQELLLKTYYTQFGMETCSLRLTAVIGPDGRGGGRGWREIADQMAAGTTVKIPHFSSEEICHYVDIRDVADMFFAAAESKKSGGEVFNCCGPKQVSGNEFAEAMIQLIPGIKVEYGFPWSMAQGGELYFSMKKAEEVLGFKPEYDLEASLSSIKDWIDQEGIRKNANSTDTKFGTGVIVENE